MSVPSPIDRSRDVSQPLNKLGPDETLKAESDHLRGTIKQSLADEITAAVAADDAKLMKFFGIYQQDDRDIRDERRRQKLEPAYFFMTRIRLPGGVCSPSQWLKLDELARTYAGETLRLTTRQTFQLHRVMKHDLRTVIQGLSDVLLDTKAACGDDTRGVMCTVNPGLSQLHAEVYALAKQASDHAVPRTGAYREIWYGAERQETDGPEEPFYGRTYMPRKFKIGFAIPPSNDIDVYSQDLGFIAIAQRGKLKGFNVAIGGGLGRTDQAPKTYPRLASVIGYVDAGQLVPVIDAVMSVQRDYGDRLDRSHARFKYTIDERGLEWVKAEIERRLGFALAAPRRYAFTSNGDPLGWVKGEDGREHCTLFIQNGRIVNTPERPMMDGLRAIARVHDGAFRITPNQNLIIADVEPKDRPKIAALMKEYGLDEFETRSGLRLNAMACVALPTCGLAMAEAERYLPDLIGRIETILDAHGLKDDPITIRMTGCPNGCARPYIAEIGLTGRAPGKYNLYLGGGFHGQRLNKMYLENVGESAILAALDKTLGHYARDRKPGERFGDFAIRAGYVAEVKEGRFFNDPQPAPTVQQKGNSAMSNADASPLVTADWVKDHLNDPKMRIFEVSVDPGVYAKAHIPGAFNLDWHVDLVDTVNRDIASREKLQGTLRKAGVKPDSTVVIYGDNNNWFAAWGAWVLDVYGLGANVKLLDGGRKLWEARKLPVTADVPSFPASSITLAERNERLRARLVDVLAIAEGRAAGKLIDIRSPDEYAGKIFAPEGVKELSIRAGHIPGAENVPWATIVNDDGTFKSVDEIRKIYAAKGVDGSLPVVTYCRIGERSSHSWFALKRILGYDVRNYDGSWTEYGNSVGVPVTNTSGTVWLGK